MNKAKITGLLLITLSLMVVTLVACSENNNSTQSDDENERFTEYSWRITITTDTKTNCKYIIYDDYKNGGITPLLKADGLPDCSN